MAGISRSQAKTINLGLFYGMGKAKLQAELGLSTKAEAEKLFNQYHDNVPFVKQLMEQASRKADNVGYLRTLLGRKCRFDKWEPRAFGIHKSLPLDVIVSKCNLTATNLSPVALIIDNISVSLIKSHDKIILLFLTDAILYNSLQNLDCVAK